MVTVTETITQNHMTEITLLSIFIHDDNVVISFQFQFQQQLLLFTQYYSRVIF